MKNDTVLIVVAHTDDEALGCGGTIIRHVGRGDIVHAVFMADGVNSRKNKTDTDLANRLSAAKIAHNILGITRVEYFGFPDNAMDNVPLLKIVQKLEDVIQSIKPDIIYTHHFGDLNIDHQIVHRAVMTACRPLPDNTVRAIYSFEVPSSTDWAGSSQDPFLPNLFVDITNYLDQKLNALAAYKLEMREPPHSRSLEHVESLARHRGNAMGVGAAESFFVVRQIIK